MTYQKQWADKVIKETCEQIQVPEEIVTAVFKDQWKRARIAQKTCNELEFGGLGKFTIKKFRVEKQLKKFENIYNAWTKQIESQSDFSETKNRKLGDLVKQIESLKNRKKKIDENKC